MGLEDDLIKLSVFLSALSVSSDIANLVKQSPFIPYIVIGALLGPPLAKFVPVSDGLSLIGFLGVTLNIMDAGLSTKLSQIRSCALRALGVAILGIIFPIAGACLVMLLYEKSSIRTALSVGSAISPTSLAVVAALLSDIGQLQSDLGVLISVAAIFDDVLSLILLSELSVIDNISTWIIIQPILFSFLFIFITLFFTCIIAPWIINNVKNCNKNTFSRFQKYKLLNFYIFILFTILMMFIAVKVETSVLLAAYVTGVAFANVYHIKSTWDSFLKSFIPALNALFFAATIGFVIPPFDALFNRPALILGAMLTVISVFGKLLCGLAMFPNWKTEAIPVAVAMLGRGEFGFLIAAQAKQDSLIDESVYAAVTWAVMIPTLLAPILFKPAFALRERHIHRRTEDQKLDRTCNDSQDIDHSPGCQRNSSENVAVNINSSFDNKNSINSVQNQNQHSVVDVESPISKSDK